MYNDIKPIKDYKVQIEFNKFLNLESSLMILESLSNDIDLTIEAESFVKNNHCFTLFQNKTKGSGISLYGKIIHKRDPAGGTQLSPLSSNPPIEEIGYAQSKDV